MRKSPLAAGIAVTMGLTALGTMPLATSAHAAGCAAPIPVSILSFTDFHGRIASASPDTSVFFATLEANRDADSVVVGNGDSIGASLFASFIQNDEPTIDILNAAGVDAHSVGNHELDRGYADFTERVLGRADFPLVSANLVKADGSPVADAAYTIATTASGVRVGVIGAITETLPSLVTPEVFAQANLTPAVAAINAQATMLKDGDPANGEADIVVSAFHEDPALNAGIGPQVDVLINGHTHLTVVDRDATGRPVIQPTNYAGGIGRTQLLVDTDDNKVCQVVSNENIVPAVPNGIDRDAYIAAFPRAAAVDTIVRRALAEAGTLGAEVIGEATAPISRGLRGDGGSDNRAVESTMSNLIAQMFREQLSGGKPNFIGVQNPGGTRADFAAGQITYAEAAAVLPFANTLMTTQLTGAQVKTMLEQQWQPAESRRPFLALGLSDNVSYTYDESRPAGERIANIVVDGAPIDPAATYTIGSGSFLIAGGDNFSVLAEGSNPTDAGRADLETWVAWLKSKGTIVPDYDRRGVPFAGTTDLTAGVPTDWTIGQPIEGSLTAQTLDMAAQAAPRATGLTAHLGSADGVPVGRAAVDDGHALLTVDLPAGTPAAAMIYLVADNGTSVAIPVRVTGAQQPTAGPGSPAPSDRDGRPGRDKMKGAPLPKTGIAG